ncbi:Helicase-associated domain protein [Cordyceps fumosorosea ARSEF 2679]|uniref:RNA helicase n=1 Tax=Cordyceps fumosorosea (strain ARSEF 2679) TaxID=1081104 RepID=A0A162MMB8_CORFA|nr:Helicase-associated domain protein [Cordyceps fumosorosea ARSEF 2679]OAA64070.1 Helicase-associated domain protein [Cordyceps fumosorosea ARSEF 2679]
MASAENGSQPAKKRKTGGQGLNIISLGNGKTLSLDGYLGPLKSKPPLKPIAESERKTTDDKPDKDISKRPDTKSPHSKSNNVGGGALLQARQALPIWRHRKEILEPLRGSGNNILVLVGETGSGKSTQVPQFLSEEPWCRRQKVKLAGSSDEVFVGGMVAITQPRRVAATTLAHRVAQEAGTPLGKWRKDGKVGYSVRFDHQVPKGAKIKFLTEGTLLQELLRDPYLRKYSAVIVDEIHERSLDADLLVGFLKKILIAGPKHRGGAPLKVVIMSATVNIEAIRGFFDDDAILQHNHKGADMLQIEGRQFPVEVQHESRPVADLQDALLKRIFKIHTEEPLPGDILAFLTGQEEIIMAQKLIEEYCASLASNVPKIKAVPLYGQLSIEAQQEAFLPVKNRFTRKVVLATNIAETSVTVSGVRYVVDGGKAKMKQFRPRLGLESLLAKPISRSSAIQRTGRAGREGPGKCYRLYTEASFDSLQSADLPEILRNDVLSAVLTMKARGIQDVFSFPLMDSPETEAIERALVHLHFLGALDDDGNINSVGETMAKLPLSAPLGAVLIAASNPEYDCLLEVIDVVSCITAGEDIFLAVHLEEGQEEVEESRKELQRREGDIITYLTTMQQYTAENADRNEWCKKRKLNTRTMKQALNIRRQLRGMCVKEKLFNEAPPADPQPFTPTSPGRAETILKCFIRGFAMKTAMLAPDASYVTSQGKHVVAIHPASVLHGRRVEAIMFLEQVYTKKNYAKKVSVIQTTWLVEALERKYKR